MSPPPSTASADISGDRDTSNAANAIRTHTRRAVRPMRRRTGSGSTRSLLQDPSCRPVDVEDAGGDAESKEQEEHPGCGSKRLVEKPAESRADRDGKDEGDADRAESPDRSHGICHGAGWAPGGR